MIAVREQRAAAADEAIDAPRDPDAEPLHAAREAGHVVGFHDEVERWRWFPWIE